MKRHRTIIIKNPRLQKIHNNLRDLITFEVIQREEDFKKDSKFAEQLALSRLLDRSICRCSGCTRDDQDMAYNPSLGEWFCVECYRLSQDTYKEILEKKSRGEPLGDLCEDYYKTFI